jgi:hypothetical protein
LLQIGQALNLTITGQKIPINRLQGFDSDCRYYNDQEWRRSVGPLGTCDARGAWNIRGTNEDQNFRPGGYFLPDDSQIDNSPGAAQKRSYWTYSYAPGADGRYTVRWILDKTASVQDVPRYSGAFLSLVSFDLKAKLSDPLFADIRLRVDKAVTRNDVGAGPAKIRTSLGVKTRWTAKAGQQITIFLEANLFRSSNFDLCTERNVGGTTTPGGNCDPRGIYDRRSFFNVGELVYYDINAMNKVAGMAQETLEPNGVSREFTIPIATLFRRYQWTSPPASWDEPRIEGMYLGHEIWGRGSIDATFESMRVYRFVAD